MNTELQLEDFKNSLIAVWKRKWLVLSATVLSGLCGLFVTLQLTFPDLYESQATVYSYKERTSEAGIASGELSSFASVVYSDRVCSKAASLIGEGYKFSAGQIRGMLSVRSANSYVMHIGAVSTDPKAARLVANAVTQAFITEVTSITESNFVRVLDNADNIALRESGGKKRSILQLKFIAAGFGLASLIIVVLSLTSNTLKTVAQCADSDQKEILGILPRID